MQNLGNSLKGIMISEDDSLCCQGRACQRMPCVRGNDDEEMRKIGNNMVLMGCMQDPRGTHVLPMPLAIAHTTRMTPVAISA